MRIIALLVFGLLLSQNGMAQLTAKVYEDANLERIVKKHKTIAIVPVNATVRDVKSKKKNRISPEELEEMEKEYRDGFQNSMYGWFLKRKQRKKIAVDIQDVTRTNALLKKAGIHTDEDLVALTFDEIATILGVDAIFYADVATTRSFDQGGAVALAIITGISVKTGDADAIIKLYNGEDGKMIWSFDRKVASSYANTPEDVADFLMKRVSKRFPYNL